MDYNADSGELVNGTSPRHGLPETLTRPQEPYRDSSEQHMDDFYQHVDHRLILLSASIGEPGHIPGFPV